MKCLNCGKEFELCPSDAKKQKCCSKKCGSEWYTKSRRLQVTCETCGKVFETEIGANRSHPRRYCSRICANARNEPVHKPCDHCGKDFIVEKGQTHFCSHACYLASIKIKNCTCPECQKSYKPRAGQVYCSPSCQQIASRKRITIKCAACGEEFTVWQSKASRSKYCSKECQIAKQFHSNEEDQVIEIVASMLGQFVERNKTFPWLKSKHNRSMHVDGYFPGCGLAVEYDGKQHRQFSAWYHRTESKFVEAQERDKLKGELLKRHGITLIRFQDNEPRTEEFIASRLKHYGVIR